MTPKTEYWFKLTLALQEEEVSTSRRLAHRQLQLQQESAGVPRAEAHDENVEVVVVKVLEETDAKNSGTETLC